MWIASNRPAPRMLCDLNLETMNSNTSKRLTASPHHHRRHLQCDRLSSPHLPASISVLCWRQRSRYPNLLRAILCAVWLDIRLPAQLQHTNIRGECKQRQTQDLLLDFEAAASALSSSLQAALAETGLLSSDPAFAFHLDWPFFANQ